MSRTGTPFPYIDRRCQARTALIIHMLARRWPIERTSAVITTQAPGLCVDCGTYFDVGTAVEYARYGNPRENRRGLVHVHCPDWADVLDSFRQESDHRLVTHAAASGRSRASCGHVVDDDFVFLIHGSGRHALDGVGTWVCADCARK